MLSLVSSFLPSGQRLPASALGAAEDTHPVQLWGCSPDRTEEIAAKALSLSPQPGFPVNNSKSISSRRKLMSSSPM